MAPPAVLALAALVVAALAASVGVDVRTIALDEALHQLQAVRYADTFPAGFVNDPFARSTARMYSLAIAPVFALADGDEAVRGARAVSALLFASAAAPAFLLGRQLGLSRWGAAVAGLLSIAAPWLALSTVLYTENLAYPAFLWAILAMAHALRDPGPRADLFAVIALAGLTFTRTQFACLIGVYTVLIGVRFALGPRSGARSSARQVARAHPVTAALALAGLAGALAVSAANGFGSLLDRALGPYRGITTRDTAPGDLSEAFFVEVGAMILGLGILPAILAAAWFVGALRDPNARAWWPALTAVVAVAAVWATAIVAQGGFLGEATEERYFFYAAPVLWIGALAAVEGRGRLATGTIVAAGLPCLVVLGTVPLVVGFNPETQFLSPVLSASRTVSERLLEGSAVLRPHDLLVALGLALLTGCALAWQRSRRVVIGLVAASALLQIGLTVYVFAAARGDVRDIGARTGEGQGRAAWVDDAPGAADGRDVTMVRGGRLSGRELELSFYNQRVSTLLNPPGAAESAAPFPTSLLASAKAVVDAEGAVRADRLAARAVQDAQSSMLQLSGRRLAAEPAGALELIKPARPTRARWAAGIDPDGNLSRRVDVVASAPEGEGAFRVTVEARAPVGAATAFELRLGGQSATLELPAAPNPAARRVTVVACGTTGGALVPITAVPLPDGRATAGMITRVDVRASRSRCGS